MPIEKIIIEKQKEAKLPVLLRASLSIYPDNRQHLSRRAISNFMEAADFSELSRYLQFRYEKIKKIKTLNKRETVYDFTVSGTHTFIANGVCSSNCHQLTKEAANALLKTLEEPPSHAVFILATTEIHKMISTIVSRCQRFDFRKLRLEEIVGRLEGLAKKEGVKVEKPALELVSLNSAGSIRDAESLFGQVLSFCGQDKEITVKEVKDLLGLVEIELISRFSDYLIGKKAKEAISLLQEVSEKEYDLAEFVKALINYLRQALILKVVGKEAGNSIVVGLTKEELEKMQSQADSFKEEDLRKALDLFLEAENRMKYSSIPQLPLELAIIEAIHFTDVRDPKE